MTSLDDQLKNIVWGLPAHRYDDHPEMVGQAVDLIKQGACANLIIDQHSVLLWAATGRSLRFVQTLLEHGAHPNGRENEQILAQALREAARLDVEIQNLGVLVLDPDLTDDHPLLCRFRKIHRSHETQVEIIKVLVAHGAQIEHPMNAYVELFSKVHSDGERLIPIIDILMQGNFDPTVVMDPSYSPPLKVLGYLKEEHAKKCAAQQARDIEQEIQLEQVGVAKLKSKF